MAPLSGLVLCVAVTGVRLLATRVLHVGGQPVPTELL